MQSSQVGVQLDQRLRRGRRRRRPPAGRPARPAVARPSSRRLDRASGRRSVGRDVAARSRSTVTTSAPRSASSAAVAAPMPLAPPVTSARRPSIRHWLAAASAISAQVAIQTSPRALTSAMNWSRNFSRCGRPITCGCIVTMQAPPSVDDAVQLVPPDLADVRWAARWCASSPCRSRTRSARASSRIHWIGSSTRSVPAMPVGVQVVHVVGRVAEAVLCEQLDRGRRELPRRRAVADRVGAEPAQHLQRAQQLGLLLGPASAWPARCACSRGGRPRARRPGSPGRGRGGARRRGPGRRTSASGRGARAARAAAAPRPWRRRCPARARPAGWRSRIVADPDLLGVEVEGECHGAAGASRPAGHLAPPEGLSVATIGAPGMGRNTLICGAAIVHADGERGRARRAPPVCALLRRRPELERFARAFVRSGERASWGLARRDPWLLAASSEAIRDERGRPGVELAQTSRRTG